MKISGKVAVITGGARGIGLACVKALLQKQAKVCIADILVEEGEDVWRSLSQQYGGDHVIFVRCDVTREGDVKNMFLETTRRLGPVEICCPAAGLIDETNWQKTMDVNQRGAFLTIYEAMKYMKEAGDSTAVSVPTAVRREGGGEVVYRTTSQCRGGVVLVISSTAAIVCSAATPVYSATKAALIAFIRSWAEAENFVETNIRMCALCPTYTDTDIMNQMVPGRVLHAEKLQERLKSAPKLQPSCVADTFIRCVEDESLNGKVVKIMANSDPEYPQFVQFPKLKPPSKTDVVPETPA